MHGVFRRVYESVEFAKLKLLARALDRATRLRGRAPRGLATCSATTSREVGAEEPYSEGIIDYLRAGRGRPARRADPRAAAATAARPGVSLRVEPGRDRRLGDRAQVGRRRPPAGRRLLERRSRSRRSPSSSGRSSSPHRRCGVAVPPRAREPAGIALVDKPAGPSSFALVAAAPPPHAAPAPAMPARSTRSRPGCCCCCPVGQLRSRRCFVGLDKRYLTEVDLTARTSTGDPEGEVVERHAAAGRRRAGGAARGAPRRGRAAGSRPPRP